MPSEQIDVSAMSPKNIEVTLDKEIEKINSL